MKIERFDLDASGKPCSEGFYATDGRTLYLMPPTGELVSGELGKRNADGKIPLRFATQDEVDRLHPYTPASAEHIANCDPTPSGDGDANRAGIVQPYTAKLAPES